MAKTVRVNLRLLKILTGTVQAYFGAAFGKTGKNNAALLELGSGFHPEFSGRQNIYLNAALLGLEREGNQGTGERSIIEFSELGDVIDRPVKTYSSGMYVRLAFSIATSVDPDILIIDEALSVGDHRFQQKCVNRMIKFKEANKTLIFCSHSMYLTNELCANTIWLYRGRVRCYGRTSKVVSEYLAYMKGEDGNEHIEMAAIAPESSSLPDILIEEMRLVDDKGKQLEHVEQFETVVFQVRTRRIGSPIKGHLSVGFERTDGQRIFATTTKISGPGPVEFAGEQIIELVIPSIPVVGGRYRAKARIGDEHAIRVIHEFDSEPFQIESERPEIGMVWMNHHWRFPKAPGPPV